MTDENRLVSGCDATRHACFETASMKVRISMMTEMCAFIHERHMTQADAAEAFGVTQSRISDLVVGQADVFVIDTLVDMADRAGMVMAVNVSN